MRSAFGKAQRRGKTVGARSVQKAILRNEVERLYVAEDAEDRVVGPVLELARGKDLEVVFVPSMKELGESFGLRVAAAVAATLKKSDDSPSGDSC